MLVLHQLAIRPATLLRTSAIQASKQSCFPKRNLQAVITFWSELQTLFPPEQLKETPVLLIRAATPGPTLTHLQESRKGNSSPPDQSCNPRPHLNHLQGSRKGKSNPLPPSGQSRNLQPHLGNSKSTKVRHGCCSCGTLFFVLSTKRGRTYA
ncbi:hypothetical protein DUNSADRAFT_579 [Dunaliella salina]|uniref:Encoded protein n=1 Tax=Dunaliella salina TaxID=3046 RepID=A0ABQ7GY34_DUNSA|nr:hypothetical protein DUNSADRAFT_579 [Dunaliella salina]|eukprot:KAF5839508.1 hypothetical protein DUNSADRAFT_579 [Dunaliella salina]